MNKERIDALNEEVVGLTAECSKLRGWLMKMEAELVELKALRDQIRSLQAAHHVLWDQRMQGTHG